MILPLDPAKRKRLDDSDADLDALDALVSSRGWELVCKKIQEIRVRDVAICCTSKNQHEIWDAQASIEAYDLVVRMPAIIAEEIAERSKDRKQGG